MNTLLVTVILLFCFSTEASDPRIKSWKTLTNENGYSFKYPDCWIVETEDPDESELPINKAKLIIVKEGKLCITPSLYGKNPNQVGIFVGLTPTPPLKEVLKKLKDYEDRAANLIGNKFWLYFKRLKIDGHEAYIDVTFNKDFNFHSINWEVVIYCPQKVVTFSGPAIKNPDPSILEKFKAGDMAMPEPAKSIFESIRCTH